MHIHSAGPVRNDCVISMTAVISIVPVTVNPWSNIGDRRSKDVGGGQGNVKSIIHGKALFVQTAFLKFPESCYRPTCQRCAESSRERVVRAIQENRRLSCYLISIPVDC